MRRAWRGGAVAARIGLSAWAAHPGAAAAQRLDLPEPRGWVNDFAEVLSAETEARLEDVVVEVRDKSAGEIVVVTLPSLQGRPLDEVALELGRRWRVGAAGEAGDPRRDLGAIFLVVPKETSPDGRGHLKIELGDNTSRFVTAGDAGRIADRYVIPAFREGDYDTGVLAGTVALAGLYADALGFELTGGAAQTVEELPGNGVSGERIVGFLVSFGFFMVLLSLAFRVVFRALAGPRGPRGPRGPGGGGGRRRRSSVVILPGRWGGGGRGGGFGGGGFGGFGGGGGFSGGGAGRSW